MLKRSVIVELLFSYGTLQLETVQLKTFGRLLNGTKDTLIAYSVSRIEISNQEKERKAAMQYIDEAIFADFKKMINDLFELSNAPNQQSLMYSAESNQK